MKPKWLLETDTFEEGLGRLIDAIHKLGFENKITYYVPFQEATELLDLYPDNDCVVTYGSIQLVKQVVENCGWTPAAYANFPNYDCTYYYPRLHQFLLNSPYIMLPYGELINQQKFLFDTVGNNECVFVRPNNGTKLFTGKVTDRQKFAKDVESFGFYDVNLEDLVVVAEPKNIQAEWRLVSVGKQIVASSQYRLNGQRNLQRGCPDEITKYAEEVVKVWEPDSAWTVDVCRLQNGDIHLLEIGSFSCAGLYACDFVPIVDAVSKQALKDWEANFEKEFR